MNLDSRHDIRFGGAYEMNLRPAMLLSGLVVIMVKPTMETAGCKARRIDCEVCFHCFQTKTVLCHERSQNWRKGFTLDVIEDRIAVIPGQADVSLGKSDLLGKARILAAAT